MSAVIEEKKPWFWKMVLEVIKIMFPIFSMMKLNSLLKKAGKIYKHPWFSRQRRWNFLMGMVATLPFLLTIVLSVYVLYKDPYFLNNIKGIYNSFFNLEPLVAMKKIGTTFSNPSFKGRMDALTPLVLGGLGVTLFLGFIIRLKHPLIEKTKVLYKLLQNNVGLIPKEEKNRLVLYTPLGCLVDIKGSTPKAIKEDTRIWTELNIKVKEFSEDPERISVVFFKKTYELKNTYLYNIK